MKSNWKYIGTAIDGQVFKINGLNIWDYKWNLAGEKIKIEDPIYNRAYLFSVYEIQDGTITVRFAAGEFSNLVWGIYEESKD